MLAPDARSGFAFAPLEGRLTRDVLAAHGTDPDQLDTLPLMSRDGTARAELGDKCRAALFILKEVDGGPWLDAVYDLLARNRYRLFGRHDACSLRGANGAAASSTSQGALARNLTHR